MNAGIRRVGYALIGLMLVLSGQLTYLQLVRSHELNHKPGNFRVQVTQLRKQRGKIITADGVVIAQSVLSHDEWKYLRQYPHGPEYAAITGYQSIVYGSTGVEAADGKVLTGSDLHFSLGGLDSIIKGPQSADVVLSINSAAQDAAMHALGNRIGSVVVLDVHTGAVVALYSNPTFDPNLLAVHDTKALGTLYNALINAPSNPLRPRAYRERYPAGSTFKVLTSAIALGAGIVTPTTPLFPRVTQIPLPLTKPVHFLNNFGSPPERCGGTLEESFTVSCNTTFASIGLQLGDQLATGAQAFGLNQSAPPLDVSPSAVQSVGPKPGTFKRTQPQFALAAIGQGDVAVTPLEMALVAESVATGGVMRVPYVVQEVRKSADQSVVRTTQPRDWRTVMTPDIATTITGFMVNVVNSPQGTGNAAQLPGVQVAGKTGTAQTVKGAAPHAWFIAFAPAEAPRYAIAVIVEHGGELASEATGGRVAAPIARAVLAKLLGVAG